MNNTTNQHLLSAGSITGDSVTNLEGKDIGKIEELMIDTQSGQVSYAVLSFGGFLGMGDKYFAIPWEAFQVDKANEKMTLDIDKQRLEDAPGFDKDNWPDFADTSYLHSVKSSYNGVGKFSYRPQ